MPVFEVDLEDGRTVTLESDFDPTEEQVHAALGSYQSPQPTSFALSPMELRPESARNLPTLSTIQGERGIPQSLDTYQTSPVERQEAFKEAALSPIVPIPRIPISPDESPWSAVPKELVNVALGIPEFMESPAGILSLGAAALAPATTAAAFSADMLKSAVDQGLTTYDEWANMTPAQRAVAITDIGATLGFSGLTGAHAIKGARAKFQKPEQTKTEVSNAIQQEAVRPVETPAEVQSRSPDVARSVEAQVPEVSGVAPEVAKAPEVVKPEDLSKRQPGEITPGEMSALPDKDASSLFDAQRQAGNANQNDGVRAGLKLTPADVPRLEKMRDEAMSQWKEHFKSGDQEAGKGAFGKVTWLNGAIEGAKKEGPNYTSVEQRMAAEPNPSSVNAPKESPAPAGVVGETPAPAAKPVEMAEARAFFPRESEATGLGEPSMPPTVEDVRRSRAAGSPPPVEPPTTPAPPAGAPAPRATLDDIYKIFEPSKTPGVSLKQRAVNIIESVRTGVSSKFRPVNKLAEDIAKSYGAPSKDIAGIMEQLKGSQGKGEAQIYRFDRDVSSLVKGSEKDFNAYIFLRRSIDRLTQDAKDIAAAQAGANVPNLNRRAVAGYTINELAPKLAALEAKLGPENLAKFRDAADGYQRYMDDALKLQVESGRMSQEVYDAIKDGNQFYAPFKVMKWIEETSQPSGSGRRIDTMADFTKAMTGIEDPNFKLGDMLGAARQSILMSRILADKNMAMRHVGELAAFDTNKQFIQKLADGADVPRGWEAVNILENGKQQRYAVRPEVAEAIQLYGPEGGGWITRALSATSVPFRAGATAFNIPFQISNLMADVPRQALVSKYGVRGVNDLVRYPMDFINSLYSSMMGDVVGSKNKLFLDFLDSGVAGATVQEFLTPNALNFKEPTNISKSRKLAGTVLSTLPNFAKAIEQTSKIVGVKRAMRFEGVSSGAELAKQIPEAITELRRFSGSPDFGRTGKAVEQARLNLLYMFLNARIQGGIADLGRLGGRDGAKTSAATWLKVGSAVAVPTAYLYYLNNRPEYKEDYAKRPQQEKQNYWMIPKDTFITTEDGEKIRDYWRVPKREVAKWFANATESALTFSDKRDPKAAADFGNSMLQDIFPVNISGDTAQQRMESVASGLNPVIKAPLEIATGRDLYRHRDLVPDQMRKASPENQFTDRTATAFKQLAVAMPDVAPEFLRSPIILENLTRNLTAGMLTQFLPRKPVEGRTDIENAALLQRFQAMPLTDQEAFKTEMQQLEREAADQQLERHRKAVKLIEDNKVGGLGVIGPKTGGDPKLLRHVVDLWIAKENGATYQDRQLLALPAKQRAAYIANKLRDASAEEKQKLFMEFSRKRILTEAVMQELPEAMK